MNMDKNQAKSNVLIYLYHSNFLPEAKKELAEISAKFREADKNRSKGGSKGGSKDSRSSRRNSRKNSRKRGCFSQSTKSNVCW